MRALAHAVGAALVLALLLWTLPMLAARITAAHLLAEARQELATLRSNQPLWCWRLRKPHDLIAGRAFGQARLTRGADAVRITSLDGTPFELGLPIASAVDLAHWPILQLELSSDAAGTLGLIRASDATICTAATATHLSPPAGTLRIDLRRLDWRLPQGGACPSPATAQMLRLRVQIPAGAVLAWRSAALLSDAPWSPAPLARIDLPDDHTSAAISPAAERSATPLFHLPASLSAEDMLALRDRLSLRWPAALVVAGDADNLNAPASPASAAWFGWAACAAYLLLLLGLGRRSARRPVHAGLEAAACLAGPLWLVVGLQWGLGLLEPGVAAAIGAVLYAATLTWRQRPADWRWRGSDWQSWLGPLALLPVTVLLVLVAGHGFKPATPIHALAYIAWACLQQWLMLAVVLPRLQRLLPQPHWAILFTAALFALLHTPNGRLMQLCLLAECWWGGCFLRSRRLLPIAVAHAACALLVEAGLVGGLLRSLEVSARFFP